MDKETLTNNLKTLFDKNITEEDHKTDNKYDKKINKVIQKYLPEGKQAKVTDAWYTTCLATFLTGMYTYAIDWNPVVRVGAHLFGAMAIPAAGAFVSNTVMNGIEHVANYGINKYNEKHPENQKESFEINPTVRKGINLLSTAIAGAAYAYGTLHTELDQFNASGIMQWGQYTADVGGALLGTAAFHNLELGETLASGFNKLRNTAYYFNRFANLGEKGLKNLFHIKSKEDPEKTSSPLQIEEINVAPDTKSIEEETPAWDLSLYQNAKESTEIKTNNIQTHHPKIETTELLDEEDEIDI